MKSARLDFGPNLSLPVYLETIHDARVKLGNLNDLAARLESERDGFREVASKVQDLDRKSTRLNSSHEWISRMPSSA